MNISALLSAIQPVTLAPGTECMSSAKAPRKSSRKRNPTLTERMTPCINCWLRAKGLHLLRGSQVGQLGDGDGHGRPCET